MSKRTKGPWRYRPIKFDDWGYIRGVENDVACVARGGDSKSHEEHRIAGTDPYAANAAAIVHWENNYPALVAALREIDCMCDNPKISRFDIREKALGALKAAGETP